MRSDVEIVNAGSGNDRVTGSSAINTFRGGDGGDTLDGGTGDDQLFEGRGDDVLTGGAGTDRLSGEEGNDTLFARDNTADILNGGPAPTVPKRITPTPSRTWRRCWPGRTQGRDVAYPV